MTNTLNATSSEQRDQLITGKPPRLTTHPTAEIVLAAQKHVAKLRTSSSPGSAPPPPESIDASAIPDMVLTLMGCHPELYEKVADVSVHLMAQSTLSRRDLELVVLRTDWLCQSPYNWGEHVTIAKRFGVSEEEIERVTRGSQADGWNEHDRALLCAAEELHRDALISDDTWEVLSREFDDKQMFELIVLVGQFTLVTYFQNSLRLPLGKNNSGLKAR